MNLDKQIEDEFLYVPLDRKSMLIYTARRSILKSIKSESSMFYGTVLDIGCGFMPYRKLIESNKTVKKFIGMDLERSAYEENILPDLKWNGNTIPLGDETIDCVMATEFLEHVAQPEKILSEVFRVTKPGGKFFATVPFIWNLHEIPNDEYRYTPYSLKRIVENAGFTNIEIKALGGWNLSLAQMIGLWVTFSKMSDRKRAIMRNLLFPFYKRLIKTDVEPTEFDGGENSMFSGLSVTARK